jgi:hypothetical protein
VIPEGCGFGPCRHSRERGGRGCHLCDVTAKLPQPKMGSRKGELTESDDVGEAALPAPETVPTQPKRKAPVKRGDGTRSLLQ